VCFIDRQIPAQNKHEVFTASDWQASTAYSAGDYVVPTSANGHIYKCTSAGTSDSGEPSWPTTDGNTVEDNTVTWQCVENGDLEHYEVSGDGYIAGGAEVTGKSLEQASGVTTFDGDNVSWTESTITARYAVIYETSTNVVLAYQDFGEDKSSSSGTFEIQWNADGIFTIEATQPA